MLDVRREAQVWLLEKSGYGTISLVSRAARHIIEHNGQSAKGHLERGGEFYRDAKLATYGTLGMFRGGRTARCKRF